DGPGHLAAGAQRGADGRRVPAAAGGRHADDPRGQDLAVRRHRHLLLGAGEPGVRLVADRAAGQPRPDRRSRTRAGHEPPAALDHPRGDVRGALRRDGRHRHVPGGAGVAGIVPRPGGVTQALGAAPAIGRAVPARWWTGKALSTLQACRAPYDVWRNAGTCRRGFSRDHLAERTKASRLKPLLQKPEATGRSRQAPRPLVISVPTPVSVKISSSTALGTRPSMMWALFTPPCTASRAQRIFGSMPP